LVGSGLWAQGDSTERIFFDAKVFTGDPQNPYAEAVAIRGNKIVAVGNASEVMKVVQRVPSASILGQEPFPGVHRFP